MKRMVMVAGLAVLAFVLVGTVVPALASTQPGTKVELPEADNMFKTIEYFVRNWGLYALALALGGGGAAMLGTRPVAGLSTIGGGVVAGLWGAVADGSSRSAAAATPGMSLASQGAMWGIWVQRAGYLLSETMALFLPLLLWRLRGWYHLTRRSA